MKQWPCLNTTMGEFPLTQEEIARHTPRVNRGTFNYGRALGRPKAAPSNSAPWEDTSTSAEYTVMEDYARALASIAGKLSHGAWSIDMALKHVRDAETLTEQAAKMVELRAVFHQVDRELETIHVAPLRFHRYGRIGNVLRRFVYRSK